MSEVVDSIVAELVARDNGYIATFDRAISKHKEFTRTVPKMDGLEVLAKGAQQYADQHNRSLDQAVAAEQRSAEKITQSRKRVSDSAKAMASAEKAAAKEAEAAVKAAAKEKAAAEKRAAKEAADAVKVAAKEKVAAEKAATREIEAAQRQQNQNQTRYYAQGPRIFNAKARQINAENRFREAEKAAGASKAEADAEKVAQAEILSSRERTARETEALETQVLTARRRARLQEIQDARRAAQQELAGPVIYDRTDVSGYRPGPGREVERERTQPLFIPNSVMSGEREAEIAAAEKVNHLKLDEFDLQQKVRVATAETATELARQLEYLRRIDTYKRLGLDEDQAMLRAEREMAATATLRAEANAGGGGFFARLTGGQGAGPNRRRGGQFSPLNEAVINATRGRFGYSLSPMAFGGLAVGAAAFGAVAAVQSAREYAKALSDVAKQAGITAEALQVYHRAATDNGATTQDFDTALTHLADQLAKARTGSKDAQKVFNALGISIKGTATAGDLLPTIIDRLSSVSDQSQRSAAELQAFGETGEKLDGMLSGGNAKISALAKALQDTGAVLSSADIAKLNDTSKKLEAVKAQLSVNIAEVVANNAEAIKDLAAAFGFLANHIGGAITAYTRMRQMGFDLLSSIGGAIVGAVDPGAFQTRDERLNNAMVGIDADDPFLRRIHHTGVQPGKVNHDLLNSLNAPKGRKGPSADTLERRRLAREKFIQDTLDDADASILASKKARTASEADQVAISHQILQAQREKALDDLRTNAKLKHLNKKEVDVLEKAVNAKFDGKAGEINYADEKNQRAVSLGIAQQQLSVDRDVLEARRDLARTTKQRRDYELKLLANAEELERVTDNPILEEGINRDLAEARHQEIPRYYSNQQIAEARARAGSFNTRHALAIQHIDRQYGGPGQQYLDSLPKTADEVGEAFQQAQVRGLENFNQGLDTAISKMLRLHGLAGQFLTDLIDIGLKRELLLPIANALYGGGNSVGASLGSSHIGGFLGSIGRLLGIGGTSAGTSGIGALIGGGAPDSLAVPAYDFTSYIAGFLADGGPAQAGKTYVVGERGPELLRMGSSDGTVIPNHAIGDINPNTRVNPVIYRGGDTNYHIRVSADHSVTPAGFATGLAQEILKEADRMDNRRQIGTLNAAPGAVSSYQKQKG